MNQSIKEQLEELRAIYQKQIEHERHPTIYSVSIKGRVHGIEDVLKDPIYAAAPDLYEAALQMIGAVRSTKLPVDQMPAIVHALQFLEMAVKKADRT